MQLLECYGVGIVAQNKDPNSDEVMVYLPSLFPESDGEVVASVETQQTKTTSPTGDTSSSTTLQSNAVPCKWMELNSHRLTAPDVREGSKVVVYKFKGQNTFRWTYFGMDGTLRLETVVWAFSSSPNINENTPVTPDNYYILLLSTHNKTVQFLTGQGNGEPTSYSITLDTGNGQLGIVDGENNIISLNSMAHSFSVSNAEKSFINIQKTDIVISCENVLTLKGTNSLCIQCNGISMNSGASLSFDCENMTMKGKEINIKGDAYIEGNVKHVGNYLLQGDFAVSGKIGAQGGFVSGADYMLGTVAFPGEGFVPAIQGSFSYNGHVHIGAHGITTPPMGI